MEKIFSKLVTIACFSSTIWSCVGEESSIPVGIEEKAVVYGNDDRQDVYAHSNEMMRMRAKESTVALMSQKMLDTSDSGNVGFNAYSLRDSKNLCSSERFRNDPAAAFCSGTLIDDDLVLTAGHCVTNQKECQDARFVFNFYRNSEDSLQTVTENDIFECQEIVVRELSNVDGRMIDYAILRMNRSASPRFTPAPVRRGGFSMNKAEKVALIGSGNGIPFKIDTGGSVRNGRASEGDYFEVNTDTFAGNSGSGVYETNDYSIVGILVRGSEDYVSDGGCKKVNVCSETGCRGEDVTYVTPAIAALCEKTPNSTLCGAAPHPSPSETESFSYQAEGTYSAQRNTTNTVVALKKGETIKVGTCQIAGADSSGDTYLRLFKGDEQVAENDDVSTDRCSFFEYVVPYTGDYEIRAGCYSNNSCRGQVAFSIQ